MKKQNKLIIGVVAVVVLVGAALAFSNTGLFKGSLQGMRAPVRCPQYIGKTSEVYHGLNAKGGCVWSCATGTQPDNASGECKCKAGLVETGKDASQRRICGVAAVVQQQELKLNFGWVSPASAHLAAGMQVEVGRFTLGLDAADVNNPGAFATVNVLSFVNLSTANLTNFTLKDYTSNGIIASNASSSAFAHTPAGGNISSFNLQQGETRTFVILADVSTNAPQQVVRFKVTSFDSIGWVINNVVKTQITLPRNAADSMSAVLTTIGAPVAQQQQVRGINRLSFDWVSPPSRVLTTGRQVEIGRFTLGAAPANVNYPTANLTINALNFVNLSTAGLTNFTLKDYTYNVNLASAARLPVFSNNAASGGNMPTQTFMQGETRTFAIYADVCTDAPNQVANLKFDGGVARHDAGDGMGSTLFPLRNWFGVDSSSATLVGASTGSEARCVRN